MLLFLAGCTSPPPVDSEPTEEVAAAPHHPVAGYTADEAAGVLTEAVRFGIPLTPPLVDLWRGFLSMGDDACPGPERVSDALEVFDAVGCTAASGFWFQGVGGGQASWLDEDRDGQPDEYREAMKTDGSMRDALGQTFLFGGSLLFRFYATPGQSGNYEAEILGTYRFSGAKTGWLAEGTSTASYLSGTIEADGRWTLLANGGFSVGTQAVGLADFGYNTACPDMPSGTISIRDADGYWYDLVYDESSCDACGEVWFDGRQDLGRACADVGPAFRMSFDEMVLRIASTPP